MNRITLEFPGNCTMPAARKIGRHGLPNPVGAGAETANPAAPMRQRSAPLVASMCALVFALSGNSAFADDENVYFTLQGGTSSASLKNIRDVGGSFEPGTTATEPGLNRSTLYGAKMGVFSRKGLLGLEAEAFTTRPAPKFQTQTFHEPTFGPFPQTRGGSHEMTTFALNVVTRMPINERFVVHVGAGPAIMRSRLQFDNEQTQVSRRVGLNTQLGLTYYFDKKISVSMEWKHSAARFGYPTHGTTEGFNADYKANHFALGLSYAFDWAGPTWPGPTLRSIFGMESGHIGPRD